MHVNAQGFGHDMQVVDRDILIAAQDAGDEMGRQPRALMELRGSPTEVGQQAL